VLEAEAKAVEHWQKLLISYALISFKGVSLNEELKMKGEE
jgi:hypothetical protein